MNFPLTASFLFQQRFFTLTGLITSETGFVKWVPLQALTPEVNVPLPHLCDKAQRTGAQALSSIKAFSDLAATLKRGPQFYSSVQH